MSKNKNYISPQEKRQKLFEIHKIAKTICDRVGKPITLVCTGKKE